MADLHASGVFDESNTQLKKLVGNTIHRSWRHLQASVGIPSGSMAFLFNIFLRAILTSLECIRDMSLIFSSRPSSCVAAWVGLSSW